MFLICMDEQDIHDKDMFFIILSILYIHVNMFYGLHRVQGWMQYLSFHKRWFRICMAVPNRRASNAAQAIIWMASGVFRSEQERPAISSIRANSPAWYAASACSR